MFYKKRRLTLFLILAIMSLGLLLAACDSKNEDERSGSLEESYSEMKVNLLKEIPTLNLGANVDPGMENFIPMEKTELLEFYEYSFDLTEVLPELKEAPGEYGVYKWPAGGYYTLNSFQYFTEDEQQTLSITMEQGKLPITGLVEAYDYELESSVVNGIEVMLAKYCKDDKEMMFAQFEYQDIGFFVTSEGISEDSFLDVVKYLCGDR